MATHDKLGVVGAKNNMKQNSWVTIGAVVIMLVSVGIAIAADAGITSIETTAEVDNNGDGAVSAFDLRITADTNCLGCNDESDDNPNINPYFKVFVVGEDGNEVELGTIHEIDNGDNVVTDYYVNVSIIRQFDSQNLEVRVELWDDDGLAPDDQIDERTYVVEYQRPAEDESTPTEIMTSTETATSTPTDTPTATESEEPTETTGYDAADQTAHVTFTNQTSNGMAVTVSSTILPENGFVLVYDTTMAAPLGSSDFVKEDQENVRVSFNQLLTENQTLIVLAFQDTNENQQYDPGIDEIYLAEGQPVMDSAKINVTG